MPLVQRRPAPPKRRATVRLPAAERRAQILHKAYDFFSEHGLTAQTRALADACGVSQRLLYSVFPNKAALINAVYEADIAGHFKAVWFVQMRDRSLSIEHRLLALYNDYYAAVLTRSWLRLFLFASLSDLEMAPAYIGTIVKSLLVIVVEEAAHEAGLQMPDNLALTQELGWALHGNVSHLAIRRHIYHDGTSLEVEKVIAMHVSVFLAGIRVVLPAAADPVGDN